MDIFEKYNIRFVPTLKVIGAAVGGVLVVLFVVQMVGSTFGSVFQKVAPTMYRGDYDNGVAMSENAAGSYGGVGGGLSIRNTVGSLPYPDAPVAGNDAEAFEVTSYNAIIESRDFAKTCGVIAGLKAKEYVIFENANEYDHGCDYAFKVANANVEEILGVLNGLDPKELSQNTYTIKQLITDFTSETEILEKKRASIDQTLADAIKAYDQIKDVAIRTQNAESLAKIIDSKIQIIERLTQQRIAINAQLDQLGRAKADQLDRLVYKYFHVNVYESKFVDGEALKDSWKAAIRDFVRDVNETIQDMTINLVALLFVAMQLVLYAVVVVIIAKYVWKLVMYLWKK
jgi:hypothetical protein